MSDIHGVAASQLTKLYSNNEIELFRLDLPAGYKLADHDTGPRILITLSDINGQRLADGSDFHVPAHQALYLDNVFSPGFQNTGGDLSYLVLSLGQHTLSLNECNNEARAQVKFLLCSNWVNVGRCERVPADEISVPGLWYNHNSGTLQEFASSENLDICSGDFIFFIDSKLWPEGLVLLQTGA